MAFNRQIFLMLLCTVVTSSGQLFLKSGMDQFRPESVLTNYTLIAGCLLYGSGALLFVYSLKYLELSVAYPVLSLSFIWVAFLSSYFFSEQVLPLQWLGIFAILAGVSFIGVSSNG